MTKKVLNSKKASWILILITLVILTVSLFVSFTTTTYAEEEEYLIEFGADYKYDSIFNATTQQTTFPKLYEVKGACLTEVANTFNSKADNTFVEIYKIKVNGQIIVKDPDTGEWEDSNLGSGDGFIYQAGEYDIEFYFQKKSTYTGDSLKLKYKQKDTEGALDVPEDGSGWKLQFGKIKINKIPAKDVLTYLANDGNGNYTVPVSELQYKGSPYQIKIQFNEAALEGSSYTEQEKENLRREVQTYINQGYGTGFPKLQLDSKDVQEVKDVGQYILKFKATTSSIDDNEDNQFTLEFKVVPQVIELNLSHIEGIIANRDIYDPENITGYTLPEQLISTGERLGNIIELSMVYDYDKVMGIAKDKEGNNYAAGFKDIYAMPGKGGEVILARNYIFEIKLLDKNYKVVSTQFRTYNDNNTIEDNEKDDAPEADQLKSFEIYKGKESGRVLYTVEKAELPSFIIEKTITQYTGVPIIPETTPMLQYQDKMITFTDEMGNVTTVIKRAESTEGSYPTAAGTYVVRIQFIDKNYTYPHGDSYEETIVVKKAVFSVTIGSIVDETASVVLGYSLGIKPEDLLIQVDGKGEFTKDLTKLEGLSEGNHKILVMTDNPNFIPLDKPIALEVSIPTLKTLKFTKFLMNFISSKLKKNPISPEMSFSRVDQTSMWFLFMILFLIVAGIMGLVTGKRYFRLAHPGKKVKLYGKEKKIAKKRKKFLQKDIYYKTLIWEKYRGKEAPAWLPPEEGAEQAEELSADASEEDAIGEETITSDEISQEGEAGVDTIE